MEGATLGTRALEMQELALQPAPRQRQCRVFGLTEDRVFWGALARLVPELVTTGWCSLRACGGLTRLLQAKAGRRRQDARRNIHDHPA